MSLTTEEKILVHAADYWDTRCWGYIDPEGRLHLNPELLVALNRGVTIEIEDKPFRRNRRVTVCFWDEEGDDDTCESVCTDIAAYAGYDDYDDFLYSFWRLGEKVFPRLEQSI